MQRELLDADEQRMRILALEVFAGQFERLIHLSSQLAPEKDGHLLAVSIIGLVCYHLELQPLRRYLPGRRPEHDNAETIAAHHCRACLRFVVPWAVSCVRSGRFLPLSRERKE